MTGFSFSSLRVRLLLLVLLAVVPALGLILYTASEQRRSAAAEAKDSALQLARSFSSSQDELIESIRQLLTALAQMPMVRDGNTAECNSVFADLLKQYPRYNNFVATKPNGDVFCSAVAPGKQINFADRPHFQAAVRTGDFAIGDYFVGRLTGKAILGFSYPVLDATGQLKAVLFSGLDLEWFNALVAKTELPAGTTLTVIDRTGTILARFPSPEKWVGKSMPNTPLKQTILSRTKGTAEAPGMDGIPRLYGFSPLGDTGGAYVSIGIPKNVAFARANSILARNLVALGIVGVLALMAAWFGADLFVLRRVNDLVSATKRLTAGDLRARTKLRYGKGELSELARTFDEMAGALQTHQREAKQAEEALQARYRELQILQEISQTILNSQDLQSVLEALLDKTLLVGSFDQAVIRLSDTSSGMLLPVASRGYRDPENVRRHRTDMRPGRLRHRAMISKHPIVVENVPEYERLSTLKREGVQSAILVPVRAQEKVLGVIQFGSRTPRIFRPEQVSLLESVGNQMGVAIQKARLLEDTQRGLEQVRALREIEQAITSTLDLQAVLDVLMEKIDIILPYSATTIRLFNKEKGLLEPLACRNLDEAEWKAERWKGGHGIPNVVFENKAPWMVSNVQTDPRVPDPEFFRRHGLVSYLGVPLIAKEEILGVLGFYTKEEHEFTNGEVEFFMTLASQAAIAIHNARLHDETKRNLEHIQALQEIDKAITSTLDLRTVLDVLLQKIDLSLPYATATVRLFNKESGLLEPVACRNLDEKEWKAEQWRGGRGIPNVVFKNKAPWMVSNVQTDPQVQDPEFFRKHGLVSYLGVPLLVKDEVLGVLSFYTKEEHEFTNEEIGFLSTLAGQAAIAIHNSQLYEEMAKLASDLSRSNRVKDEFLSIMSHELRTPLNVVMGYAGMIRDGLLGEINPEQEKALEKVISRARDQLTMISSILQATQMEAEGVKVERREVRLKDFLDDLKSSYSMPLGKELSLEWDYPSDLPAIQTDDEKLKHILQNLVNNAVKFTDKGTVTVSASVKKAAGERQQAIDGQDGTGNRQESFMLTPSASSLTPSWVQFKVTDTGIGIAKEFFPVIFERFRQVDSSETRNYGGVGIGLYIVKKFTELLEGKVEVESEPGKGSTFTVTIPCESYQSVVDQQGLLAQGREMNA